MDFSVVIPVYNSDNSLEELFSRIKEVLGALGGDFEVIFVDDASSDNSWSILKSIRKRDKRAKIIQLLNNAGQHNALRCGLNYAKGRYIITMDDDLQHPPEEIPNLVNHLRENTDCDVVFGIPQKREHSYFRNIGSKIVNKIVDMNIHKPKNISISSFRCMRDVLKEAILNYEGGHIAIGSLICQSTSRMASVVVKHEKGKLGKSRYSLKKLLVLALSNVFNYSTLPLQIISYIGFVISTGSFVFLLITVYRRLTGIIKQAGFTTIVCLLCFFSGTILLCFGILGEYIIRIVKNISYERQYIVREKDL